MKRGLLTLLLLAAIFSANAQEYRKSLGIVAGTLDGLSYKGYVKDYEHFVFQFDACWQWAYVPQGIRYDYQIDGNLKSYTEYTYISEFPATQYQAALLSFSFLHQETFKSTPVGNWNWYMGGGFGIGSSWGYGLDDISLVLKPYKEERPWLKLEQHLLGGVEYSFAKTPLVIGLDMRPGFLQNYLIKGVGANSKQIYQLAFDWAVNLTLRYRFPAK